MEVLTDPTVLIVGALYIAFNLGLIYWNKVIEARYKVLHADSVKLKEETVKLLIENQRVLDGIAQARKPAALIKHINKEHEMQWIYRDREKIKQIPYDEFMLWVEHHDDDFLSEAIPYFEAAFLNDKAKIIEGYLRNKNIK